MVCCSNSRQPASRPGRTRSEDNRRNLRVMTAVSILRGPLARSFSQTYLLVFINGRNSRAFHIPGTGSSEFTHVTGEPALDSRSPALTIANSLDAQRPLIHARTREPFEQEIFSSISPTPVGHVSSKRRSGPRSPDHRRRSDRRGGGEAVRRGGPAGGRARTRRLAGLFQGARQSSRFRADPGPPLVGQSQPPPGARRLSH